MLPTSKATWTDALPKTNGGCTHVREGGETRKVRVEKKKCTWVGEEGGVESGGEISRGIGMRFRVMTPQDHTIQVDWDTIHQTGFGGTQCDAAFTDWSIIQGAR